MCSSTCPAVFWRNGERERKRQREAGMHKASIEEIRRAARPVAEEKRTAKRGGKSRGKRLVE